MKRFTVILVLCLFPGAIYAQLKHYWQSPEYSFKIDNAQVVDLDGDGGWELLVRDDERLVALDLLTRSEKWAYNAGDLFSLIDWTHDYNNDGDNDVVIQYFFSKPMIIDLVHNRVLLDPGTFSSIQNPDLEATANLGGGKALLNGETDSTYTFHLIDLNTQLIDWSYIFKKDTASTFYPQIDFIALSDINTDNIIDFGINHEPYWVGGEKEYVYVIGGSDRDTLLYLSDADTSYFLYTNSANMTDLNGDSKNDILIYKEYGIADYKIDFYVQEVTLPSAVSRFQTVINKYYLAQNYPNPFNPSTDIEFILPVDNFVSLKIFNSLGQEIRALVEGMLPAGEYKFRWDGMNNANQNVAAGVYFYRIKSGDFIRTKRMLMLK